MSQKGEVGLFGRSTVKTTVTVWHSLPECGSRKFLQISHRDQSHNLTKKQKLNFQSRTYLTDDLDVPKQRRQYLGSRGACACQKASRPWRGVPGCGPLLCPTFPLSLDLLGSASGSRRGATALRDTTPVTSFEGGGLCRRGLVGGDGGGGGGSAFYRAPRFLTSSLSHARSHAALAQTPRGGFGNPSSDPNVCAQSRTKAHQRRRLPAESSGCRVPFLLVCSSRN